MDRVRVVYVADQMVVSQRDMESIRFLLTALHRHWLLRLLLYNLGTCLMSGGIKTEANPEINIMVYL
jgi:hypothetical protein